jgi:hypothetical protein
MACAMQNNTSVDAGGFSNANLTTASAYKASSAPIGSEVEHSTKIVDRGASAQEFLLRAAEKEKQKVKACVEYVRDKIDEDILGIDRNGWFRSFIGSYTSNRRASNLDLQRAINELERIESYLSVEACSRKPFYEQLAQRHWYAWSLINKVVEGEVNKFEAVRGSTIDTMFNSQKQIGNLSHVMIALIEQKVKVENAKKLFERLDHRLADVPIYGNSNIHLTQLSASDHVYGKDLATSVDSRYAKSTDINGETIIWDMENGCAVNISGDNIQWERRRSREEYDPHAVIDRADEHAIFLDSPLSITYVKTSGNGRYTMTLFKRPTPKSRLCQKALQNSYGNQEELHALLGSQTFKDLKGFPAANLKFLIDRELEKLRAKL